VSEFVTYLYVIFYRRDEMSKKPGRPRKYFEKRGSLTIRLRGEVRKNIEKRAKKSGRSLSEEIEWALERDHHRTGVFDPGEFKFLCEVIRNEMSAIAMKRRRDEKDLA
jgi:hypothetical protein